MKSTITRNGQITLVKELREKLALKEGTVVEMNKIGNTIIISKPSKDIWRNIGRFLPDNFEKTLGSIREDYNKRLEELNK